MTSSVHAVPAAPTVVARAVNFLRRAWVAELRVYSSIGRAVVRKPAVAPAATGIGYHRPVMSILFIFIGLSAVEIPIIDLIVHRWPTVRLIMLILGVWGVTWMVGLLCAMIVRPHTVGPAGIRVRSGLEVDVPLGWDDVASVAIDRRVDEPKRPRVNGAEYAERMQDETNIEIELESPTLIRPPGLPPKGGWHAVTRVRLWADDPRAFVDAARPLLLPTE